jgi:hypothetical protein
MSSKDHKGIDPEGLQELLEVLEKVGEIDLSKVERELEAEHSPNDLLIRALKNKQSIRRGLKGSTVKIKPLHWKQKRGIHRRYYHEVRVPRRKAQLAEELQTGEGWYRYVTACWKRHKEPYRLKEKEFLEFIYPHFEGGLPVFVRYDKSKPFSLENIYVLDQDTHRCMFCGMEHKMIRMGYALSPDTDTPEGVRPQAEQ